LCAAYSDRAGVAFGVQLARGVRKITDAIEGSRGLTVRELNPDELMPYDPHFTLFFNVNTPDDYARAIELGAEVEDDHGA
jgi:molybdopterin-guanine dinucleotide biosynthesis protein A